MLSSAVAAGGVGGAMEPDAATGSFGLSTAGDGLKLEQGFLDFGAVAWACRCCCWSSLLRAVFSYLASARGV